MTIATLMTTEEMMALPANGVYREIYEGELRERPKTRTSGRHSRSTTRVAYLVERHLESFPPPPLGTLFTGDAGFRILRDPDTTVGIDLAYVSASRLAPDLVADTFIDIAPDWAVEIISKSDRQAEIDDKVEAFLKAGIKLIWLINPRLEWVMVIRGKSDVRTFTSGQEINADPVLPGFQCKVEELLR